MAISKEITQQLERCSRCGSCMAVCPVYRETGEESMVARGKLSLIEAYQQRELSQPRKLQKIMEGCLLCSGCAHHCANGLQPDTIIQWQRSKLREEGRASWTAKLAANVLETVNKWPNLAGQAGNFVQALLCKKIPGDSGLQLRFSAAVLSQRSYVPKLSPSPFLAQMDESFPGSGVRVGLFVGCVGNYISPQISKAAVELLRRCGFEVIIPADQRCCGMAAWASGDVDGSASLAEHNSRVFLESGCSWVVTACGTCATHLRFRLPELADQRVPDGANLFSQSSMDLIAFIAQQRKPNEIQQVLASPGSLKVSYHDPCHLRYHQSIFQQPRQMLALMPEILLAELPGDHQCCGHGGLFNVSNYRLSTQIGRRKMGQVQKVRPEVLATGCMGCLLQLQEASWRSSLGITVCHLVEILLGTLRA